MTKAELLALSNATFPDNNSGQITPQGHRNFNAAMIDSYEEIIDTTPRLTGRVVNGKPTWQMYWQYTITQEDFDETGKIGSILIPFPQDKSLYKIWGKWGINVYYTHETLIGNPILDFSGNNEIARMYIWKSYIFRIILQANISTYIDNRIMAFFEYY
ncbi:hypothetical protein FACS1894195_0070 [Bacteroidia bacterium]|nr:hypothetical protein FACS1894195_0070 [Bacteroidia bacterium]